MKPLLRCLSLVLVASLPLKAQAAGLNCQIPLGKDIVGENLQESLAQFEAGDSLGVELNFDNRAAFDRAIATLQANSVFIASASFGGDFIPVNESLKERITGKLSSLLASVLIDRGTPHNRGRIYARFQNRQMVYMALTFEGLLEANAVRSQFEGPKVFVTRAKRQAREKIHPHYLERWDLMTGDRRLALSLSVQWDPKTFERLAKNLESLKNQGLLDWLSDSHYNSFQGRGYITISAKKEVLEQILEDFPEIDIAQLE